MLGAWCLGTVGGCWQRDARAYYVQDVWTRVTEANEELVWDTPASVHVMFTWALGTHVLRQGLLAWAVRQYRKAQRKCSLCATSMREGHSAGSAPASNTERPGHHPERPGQQQWVRNLHGPRNHRKFVGMQSGLCRSGSPGEAISYL